MPAKTTSEINDAAPASQTEGCGSSGSDGVTLGSPRLRGGL